MAKHKNELVTREASRAGQALERITERALERLTVAAAGALKAADLVNGDGRSFQMVASGDDVTALIKAPGLSVQFRNGEFAVDVAAARKA